MTINDCCELLISHPDEGAVREMLGILGLAAIEARQYLPDLLENNAAKSALDAGIGMAFYKFVEDIMTPEEFFSDGERIIEELNKLTK